MMTAKKNLLNDKSLKLPFAIWRKNCFRRIVQLDTMKSENKIRLIATTIDNDPIYVILTEIVYQAKAHLRNT